MSENSREILKQRIAMAQADADEKRGAVLRDIDRIYENPKVALKEMQRVVGDGDGTNLVKKLQEYPGYFGTGNGSLGSKTAFTLKGFSDRALVKELVATLPEKVKATLEAEKKLLALERVYDHSGPPLSGGPSRGKGGIDF